ncbi:DNA/RNA polymerase superfamily protein [Abeliophyllum distichum]|uniref:DNA/RNA polymerase superfamily protein n=1 Tax=Abeliophyllum distichum TaxID=126358 RepID=A0ABD1Q6A7_9LAMI
MVQYTSQLIADLRVRALLRELLVQDRVRVLVASVSASRHDQNQNTRAGKAGGSTGVHANITSSSSVQQKGQAGRPRAQGRVFAITQQDAEESLDVVMVSDLVVATPVGDLLLANSVYKDYVIKLNDQELKANLIPLDINDFDVILGMDFLAANRASVDCFRKEVVF